MKKINSILLFIVGILFLVACAEEERNPQILLVTAPTVTSPTATKSYIITEANVASVLETFSWSGADFGYPAAITYTLQFAEAGKNFASPINIVSTGNLGYALTGTELNQTLIGRNYKAGSLVSLEGRVIASIGEYAPAQYSSVFKFSVIPFEAKLPPIYLLGDGTVNGWDNQKAQPMPYWSVGVYGVVTPLKANLQIKAIKTLGAWFPMWGLDAGTWDTGKLKYRPGDPNDPPSVPSPPTAGDYLVVFNIDALIYSVTAMPNVVYLVGDGCTAGWTPTAGLAFTKTAIGKYSLTTALTASKNLKIMYSNSGAWAPQWGTSAGAISLLGKLVFRPNEAASDPASIPTPSVAGTYKIELDFSENTYKISQ